MEKDQGNYSGNFPGLDYNPLEFQTHHHQDKMKSSSTSVPDRAHNDQIVDYMLNNSNPPPPTPPPNFYGSGSFDKLSFADVMQFADFGPKLALNQTKAAPQDQDDDVYFLKFPVLNDHHNHHHKLQDHDDYEDDDDDRLGMDDRTLDEENTTSMFLGGNVEKIRTGEANNNNKSNKRKRPRSVKTSEEVESQRMTHIAVERNRRKQMNEHLRVLRSLMPSSYVQRGDQASIIGGAIEFVRELEQLLQCLESQKRRRLYGDAAAGQRPVVGDPSSQQAPPLMFPPPMPVPMPINNNPNDNNIVEYETGLAREETAESKSCLADVEVKLLGFDALIKILSRRRPGQLIKTIAALEDMQLNILHTNITTIEQTVLYSFNVKIGGEARFTAEDMANSVQQILSFIHASSSI